MIDSEELFCLLSPKWPRVEPMNPLLTNILEVTMQDGVMDIDGCCIILVIDTKIFLDIKVYLVLLKIFKDFIVLLSAMYKQLVEMKWQMVHGLSLKA